MANCYGVKATQGKRNHMEDTYAIRRLEGGERFFAVYDGHGGSHVALTCSTHLHINLQNSISSGMKMEESLVDAFETTDKNLSEAAETGSTAAVFIVGNDGKYWVAHCGDSRVIFARSNGSACLTSDHTPYREDERNRVKESDGFVVHLDGTDRVMGILAVTRAVGDHCLRKYGVTCVPEVMTFDKSNDDEFVILATDGLFSVMSNEEAVDLTRRTIDRAISRNVDRCGAFKISANVLIRIAVERGLQDNLTVIVANLRP